MTSRIIVKNLPKDIKETRLRSIFEPHGSITECRLMYTSAGVFRKFAFIGFSQADATEKAVNYRNKTYIDTSRISVELADRVGDEKARAWSKYSEESSAYKRQQYAEEQQSDQKKVAPGKDESSKKKADKKNKAENAAQDSKKAELSKDPLYQEFLALHKAPSARPTFLDNVGLPTLGASSADVSERGNPSDVDQSAAGKGEGSDEGSSDEAGAEEEDQSGGREMSDLDFLRKMKGLSSSPEKSKSTETSGEKSSSGSSAKAPLFTAKLTKLPPNIQEKTLRTFFAPLKTVDIRVPRNSQRRTIGVAFVAFHSKVDAEAAVRRSKSIIAEKRIIIKMAASHEELGVKESKVQKSVPLRTLADTAEPIAESGRLFVRNLAYSATEDNLREFFAKYGPVSELRLPRDPETNQLKGFCHVVYLFPEHAVKAYGELDGTAFQGRRIHIHPGKDMGEDENDEVDEASLPFKKRQELQRKRLAGSSYNWNTLFLGANAAADVMADKYETSKSDILDPNAKQSVAVRLALGETEIVSQNKAFLTEHGVKFDVFGQAAGPRSKTSFLIKFLPAGTKEAAIREACEKYGTITGLVLAPHGTMAKIEYMNEEQAKKAYSKLAYSKFGPSMLKLEWAAVALSSAPPPSSSSKEDAATSASSQQKDAGADTAALSAAEEAAVTGATLFVKNLNFSTSDDDFQKHFVKAGAIRSAVVSKKRSPKGKMLSLGYGFITFASKDGLMNALKTLQGSTLDDHTLELKASNRTAAPVSPSRRQKQGVDGTPPSAKILVKNVPFEAKYSEVKELFEVFGELQSVRLPKKAVGNGRHRGFAFVSFVSQEDAVRAFEALCASTHLYGRRLVLDWAADDESVTELRMKTAVRFGSGEGDRKRFRKTEMEEQLKLQPSSSTAAGDED